MLGLVLTKISNVTMQIAAAMESEAPAVVASVRSLPENLIIVQLQHHVQTMLRVKSICDCRGEEIICSNLGSFR